jgi:hypothetical protein
MPSRSTLAATCLAGLVLLAACDAAPAPPTPRPVGGTPASPREVNLIAKDYSFLPGELDLIPGETVLLHVINGGLEPHEAVFGAGPVQDAWEIAEAATADAPPGPTPQVSVPPDVAGLRIVVASGQRVDVRWTVPADVATDAPIPSPGSSPDPRTWLVACHIPGHLANGMWIAVRWVTAAQP